MIFSLPKVDQYGALAIHNTPQNNLGEYFCDNQENRLWVYLRADDDIEKGYAVASAGTTDINTGLLAAPAGSNELNFGTTVNLDTTFPRVPNQPQFKEYMVVHTAGGSQAGTVYRHRQRSMDVQWFTELDLSLFSQLSANADLTFSKPWLAREAPAPTGDVIGFAQRYISQGQYFWALVEGIGVGYAAAAVLQHAPLRVTASSGELDDADGSPTPCAYALTDQNSADELVPIVACAPVRIGIPPFRGEQSQISYQHPEA